MTVSRTDALKLSTAAYDMGAEVLRGILRRAAEDAHWTIGDTDLDELLQRFGDQELLLIVVPVGARPSERNICRTCGTEYVGDECPNCREVRQRLRKPIL